MKQNSFLWLQHWYQSHCNGDWEHGPGIHISTIDNPGWSIKIDLQDTELQNKQFNRIHVEHTENDWIICFVEESSFQGACGPTNLLEVLMIFQKWATQ